MISDVQSGEYAVKNIFIEYFPEHSFDKWNSNIPSNVVEHFLKVSKGSSTIRVDSFIKDLWDL